MPKDTKTLGNNNARACESLGFVHKKRLCQRFDTTSFYVISFICLFRFLSGHISSQEEIFYLLLTLNVFQPVGCSIIIILSA